MYELVLASIRTCEAVITFVFHRSIFLDAFSIILFVTGHRYLPLFSCASQPLRFQFYRLIICVLTTGSFLDLGGFRSYSRSRAPADPGQGRDCHAKLPAKYHGALQASDG